MDRLAELRKVIKSEKLDGMLITKDQNQFYFEGFIGSECYYLITEGKSFLIADSRYTEMASQSCRYAEIVQHRDPFPPYNEVIAELCSSNNIKKLGFEADSMKYLQYSSIKSDLDKCGAEMLPTENLCENIRAVKDDSEIELIAKACEIADKSLRELITFMKPGISEMALVRELEYIMCKNGADKPSFSTMVLFGAKASQPHAVPSHDALLKEGDLILIDYGASYRGYLSDTTRTFVCGKADPKQEENYKRVLAPQIAGVEAVKRGNTTFNVDKASRDLLRGEGCFTYGVGHGVGLEIHEQPFMRRTTSFPLEDNMIVTVEPGIYIPGWGGIRIEDTVCVKGDSALILTKFPKDILISV